MPITELIEKVRAGGRVDAAEALELYRSAPTPVLGQLADEIRQRKHPDEARILFFADVAFEMHAVDRIRPIEDDDR